MNTIESIDFDAIASNAQRAEEFRRECQIDARNAEFRLLSRSEANTKLRKSMRTDYRICSLNLAHHRSSGNNVCEQASAKCSACCVGSESSGLAQIYAQVMAGRIRKTRFLFANRTRFLRQLIGELQSELDNAERLGSQLCARLNCFSDIAWESAEFGCIPQLFPEVQLYDYSKRHSRILTAPPNYHLTASWSELKRHQTTCIALLRSGHNVAIPFHNANGSAGNRSGNQTLPGWIVLDGHRFEVYDGDNGTGPGCDGDPHYDLRFLDPGPTRAGFGRVCGLRLKAGNTATRQIGMRGFSLLTGGAS